MKYMLPNGVAIEGTPEQVSMVAKQLGHTVNFRGFYMSETHGLLDIVTMNTQHIQNALLKIYRAWVTNLNSIKDNKELLHALRDGPNSVEFTDLLIELVKRA